LQFLLQTLEAGAGFADGSDLFLQDDVLRRGGPDDFRKPSQVGRAPSGPTGVAAIVAEQEGCETELGVFEITDGILTRTGEITHGFIFSFGDIDPGEVPGTSQTGELYGLPTISLDPIAGLFGDQRGRYHPAVVPFCAQIPIEPVPTRAGFIDKDEVFGF
jgi:hypothetical protein